MASGTDYKLAFASKANNSAGNLADTTGTPSLTGASTSTSASGGGGGSVTSVTGAGSASVSPTTGAVVVTVPTSLPPNGAAGGDLSGTYPNPAVAKLQSRAVANTAPVLSQVLRWTAGPTWAPMFGGYIYPEDYGAVGNGTTDDSTAIMAAYAAVGNTKALFLSGNYGIGTGTALNFSGGSSVMSTGNAKFVPASSPATNCLKISSNSNGGGILFLPSIEGFSSGTSLLLDGIGIMRIFVPTISASLVAVEMTSANAGCPDNWVEVTWITSCVTALKITGGTTSNLLQGNRFIFNYCGTVKHMFNFDGGSNACDSNELYIGATDDGASGSGAIFFQNDQTLGSNPTINWTFTVGMWNGGLADPPTSMITAGATVSSPGLFRNCRFYMANLQTASAHSVSWYNIQGLGNEYKTCVAGANYAYGNYVWQTASGNAAAFVGSLGYQYVNQYFCTAAIASPIASGSTLTMYVYSPFWDAGGGQNGSTNYRIIPTSYSYVNQGLHLETVNPSSTVAGEVQLIWRNVSTATINPGAGIGLDFLFCHGLP